MTLQYCSGFCHTSTWISHRCTPNPQLPTPKLSSPSHPSGQSQSTGVECPAPCIKLAMLIYFTEGNIHQFSQSVSSVAQSCLTLCDPVNHQLLEFTHTHIHRVGDATQPSHCLSSPSPPAPNPSQHQSLFQWVNSSHEVAKVLEFQL